MKISFFLSLIFFLSVNSISSLNSVQSAEIEVLRFKDTNIRVVIRSIAAQAYRDGRKVNITVSPKVEGVVTIDLEEVDWISALSTLLQTYNYDYMWISERVILVSTFEDITERKSRQAEQIEIEPLMTRVQFIHFSNAQEMMPTLESFLSSRGKIETNQRTNSLIITDTPTKLEELTNVIAQLDKERPQIYIEAKFVEVNKGRLKELGFDWGTGTQQVPALLPHRKPVTVYYETEDAEGFSIKETYEDIVTALPQALSSSGARALTGQVIPTEGLGLELLFQKLTGTQFEVLLTAMEDESIADVISNPKIMTMENREAEILVGTIVPIPTYGYSSETGTTIVRGYESEEIGIKFKVTPSVIKDDLLGLKIRPEVREITGWTGPNNERPIISTREAQTEINMLNGETIMIGGLVKDKTINSEIGIPLLKDIPFLGRLFRKDRHEREKIDLVIFITAKIVEPGDSDFYIYSRVAE